MIESANKIKGIIVEIGGDTVGLQKALEDVNDQSRNLSSELREVEKALKLDPTNITLLAQKHELLSKQVENAKEKLNALKNVQNQVEQQFKNGEIGEEQYRAFQREVALAESNVKRLDSQLEETKAAMDNAADGADELSKSIDNTGNEAKNLDKNLEQSESKLTKFGDVLKKIGAAAINVFATIGKAVIDTGEKIWDMSNEVASAGDTIDKTSQKIGISAESYQEWGYVFERCGADVNNLQTGMKKLSGVITEATNGSDKAKEKLAAVGLSIEDLNGKSQDEQLSIVISALQKMESGASRTAAANNLLGKSAVDMAAVLNTSAEDTQALKDEAHKYGMIMSNEAVAASATFEDSLTKLNHTIDGLKNNMIGALLPAITQIMDALTDLIAGKESAEQAMDKAMTSLGNALNNGLGLITQRIPLVLRAAKTLVEGIINNLPGLVRAELEVVVELANGIVAALPELIPAIVDYIVTITDTLTSPDMLSQILDAALDLLITLSEGLMDAIPQLVTATIQIIDNLIQFLVEPQNLSKIINAALRIVIALVTGLISAIPQLVEGVLRLVTSIGDTIVHTDWAEVGRNIIDGLWQGLQNAWGNLSHWFENSVNSLVSDVSGWLGIHSPSKVFAGIGNYMALGLGEGFTKSMSDISEDITNAIPTEFDISPEISSSGAVSGTDRDNISASGQRIVLMLNIENFYNQNKQDLDEIMEYAGNYFSAQMARQGVVF